LTDAISEVEGLLAGRVGLRLDPGLRSRLIHSVEQEAGAAGLTLDGYAAVVEKDPVVFQRLLNRITVQKTSFFRDPEVFDVLATEVVPALNEPVLAWSAGCANGQEAYSLAMVFEEAGLRDWSIVATDISTRALLRAKEATYSADEISGLGQARLARHMRATGNRWQVVPSLRARVRFQHHNLISDPSPVPGGQWPIILCRNVLIYFSSPQLNHVLDKLADALDPRGHLFLGASESLWQLTNRFRLVRLGAAFAYVLPSAGGASERRRVVDRRPDDPDRRRPQTVAQLLAAGEAAAGAGDFAAAAQAFRSATFIDPEHPVPHFQLALCLERGGLIDASRRSLREAQAAFRTCETSRLEAALEGYEPDEFIKAIELRLDGSAP
jgi:chemotaxis methyl-accepting protein methylase